MFGWQEAFAQQALQNGLDTRSMHELQNKQMRLNHTTQNTMWDMLDQHKDIQ